MFFRDDVFIESVDSIISGSCTMDATAKYRRILMRYWWMNMGIKTPGEMRDLFAPFGLKLACILD